MTSKDFELPRTALITGASRGLGRALALALDRAGYGLALVARGRPGLIETVAAIERQRAEKFSRSTQPVGERPPLIALASDVADKDHIHGIAYQALDALGSVGLLINNASDLGPVPLRPLLDTDCEDFERTLQVNLLGPMRLTKVVLPQMLLRGSGIVVNVTSDAAVEPYPNWGAYGASKAALTQLSKIWGEEVRKSGVRFYAIDPGEMDTQMHRQAMPEADPTKLASPEHVAERLLWETLELSR